MSSNVPAPAGQVPDAVSRPETLPAGLSSPSAAPAPRTRRRLRVFLLLLLAGLLAAGGWLWQTLRVRGIWQKADAALARNDLAAAADHLSRYLEHRPRDVAGWFLAARTARRLGRYAEAEEHLKHCQNLGGVTDATRLEWDLLRIQQGEFGEVHTRLRLTVTPDHPDAAVVLEALARAYLHWGRLRDGLQACDMWASLQPDHPWPFLFRGAIYERLANNSPALADYRRAVENAPDSRDARLAVGNLSVAARQPAAAVEHFEYLLERAPDDNEALLGLAASWMDQGKPAKAVPLLDRVLAKEPAPARGLFLRGKAALELHDPAAAERWLTRAADQAPDDPEAVHQLILALRAQGKQAEAGRLAPRFEAVRRDHNEMSRLLRAVALAPDDAQFRHEAGVVSLRLGRHEEGVQWLLSALRARGDHRPSHAALAEHFRRTGDPRAEFHRRLAEPPE